MKKIYKKIITIQIIQKCNKNEFITIITRNLQDNFDYMAQKYYIYQLIFEIGENFSETILKEFNKGMLNILNEEITESFYQNIYNNKFKMLENYIKEYFENEEIVKFNNYFDNKSATCSFCNLF